MACDRNMTVSSLKSKAFRVREKVRNSRIAEAPALPVTALKIGAGATVAALPQPAVLGLVVPLQAVERSETSPADVAPYGGHH
jgi:hypothetical protein